MLFRENFRNGLKSRFLLLKGQSRDKADTVLAESGKLMSLTIPAILILTTAVMWYSVDPARTLDETRETIAAMFGHFCRGILPDGGS